MIFDKLIDLFAWCQRIISDRKTLIAALVGLVLAAVLYHILPSYVPEGLNFQSKHIWASLPEGVMAILALLATCAFIARRIDRYNVSLDDLATKCNPGVSIIAIILFYGIIWFTVLDHNFARDDYMHLSTLLERIPTIEPLQFLSALDGVDGNYRPLSMYYYPALLMKVGMIEPRHFMLVQFFLNILMMLVLVYLARLLKLGLVGAALAFIFYTTRGATYTQAGWFSAVSGVLVLIFTGIAFIMWNLSRVDKRVSPVLGLPISLLMYTLAVLSKQSALTFPLLIVFAEWFTIQNKGIARRLKSSIIVSLPYWVISVGVFIWAKILREGTTPYEIRIDLAHLFRVPTYLVWVFFGTYLPLSHRTSVMLFNILGIVLIFTLVVIFWKYKLIGKMYGSQKFLGLASLIPISMLAFIPDRFQPYYLIPSLFWLSILVGSGLEQLLERIIDQRKRMKVFVGTAFLIAFIGVSEVQLKEMHLLWSGGYPQGSDFQRFPALHEAMEEAMGTNEPETLVLVDFPFRRAWYAGLVRVEFPSVKRVIFTERKLDGTRYLVNDRQGYFETKGGSIDLTSPAAHQWDTEITEHEYLTLLGDDGTKLLHLRYDADDRITNLK